MSVRGTYRPSVGKLSIVKVDNGVEATLTFTLSTYKEHQISLTAFVGKSRAGPHSEINIYNEVDTFEGLNTSQMRNLARAYTEMSIVADMLDAVYPAFPDSLREYCSDC